MNNLRKLLPCPGWKHRGRGVMIEAGCVRYHTLGAGAVPFLLEMPPEAEIEKYRDRDRDGE